jgi:hypothetical protein
MSDYAIGSAVEVKAGPWAEVTGVVVDATRIGCPPQDRVQVHLHGYHLSLWFDPSNLISTTLPGDPLSAPALL